MKHRLDRWKLKKNVKKQRDQNDPNIKTINDSDYYEVISDFTGFTSKNRGVVPKADVKELIDEFETRTIRIHGDIEGIKDAIEHIENMKESIEDSISYIDEYLESAEDIIEKFTKKFSIK